MRERLINTNDLKPGMKLAKPLFSKLSNTAILSKDLVLDQASIDKARNLGVGLAYIYDDRPESEQEEIRKKTKGIIVLTEAPAKETSDSVQTEPLQAASSGSAYYSHGFSTPYSAYGTQQPAAAKPRVLIVDDELEICEYMKAIIEERNFDAIIAQNANDAWIHLINDPLITTVFLDIKMPVVDGFELLKTMRAQIQRPLEVIMVTASRSVQDVLMARELGALDFVMKPFSPERLTRFLEARPVMA